MQRRKAICQSSPMRLRLNECEKLLICSSFSCLFCNFHSEFDVGLRYIVGYYKSEGYDIAINHASVKYTSVLCVLAG